MALLFSITLSMMTHAMMDASPPIVASSAPTMTFESMFHVERLYYQSLTKRTHRAATP